MTHLKACFFSITITTVFLTNLDRLRHRTVPPPYPTVPHRTHRFLRFLALKNLKTVGTVRYGEVRWGTVGYGTVTVGVRYGDGEGTVR